MAKVNVTLDRPVLLFFCCSRTRWSIVEPSKPQTESRTDWVNGYNVLRKRWHNSIDDKVLIYGLGDTRLALTVYTKEPVRMGPASQYLDKR
jgi:hypothetical protein